MDGMARRRIALLHRSEQRLRSCVLENGMTWHRRMTTSFHRSAARTARVLCSLSRGDVRRHRGDGGRRRVLPRDPRGRPAQAEQARLRAVARLPARPPRAPPRARLEAPSCRRPTTGAAATCSAARAIRGVLCRRRDGGRLPARPPRAPPRARLEAPSCRRRDGGRLPARPPRAPPHARLETTTRRWRWRAGRYGQGVGAPATAGGTRNS